MSNRFPAASYKDVARVAKTLGFYLCRHASGSHEVWRRERDCRQTTIPNHGKKILKRKTLKAIMGDLCVSAEEFIKIKNN